jgi:deazaflavin-dependent oxidoreductase (nitroreductase family)
MTGAKSGRIIEMPLMYVPYNEGVLLVASMGGSPKNPVWYNNIAGNPNITVRYRGKRMSLQARLATAAEKPLLWPICDSHYAPYADYRARTDRDIPIFVCEPA